MSYWICQLVGWGLYTIIQSAATAAVDQRPWLGIATLEWLLLSLIGLGLTHGLRGYIHRHRWRELPLRKLALRCLAASALLGVPLGAVLALSSVGQQHLPPWVAQHDFTTLFTLLIAFVNASFLLLTWEAVYFTVLGIRDHQQAKLRQSELARNLQQAELRLLKSQLNPHFLFNALNTVRSLIVEDTIKAQQAVTRLANTLRYTLSAGQHELVSFARELEIVTDYLELEKLRFEERLTIQREVGANTGNAQIPSMLLQTVVENAIKHGIAELPEGGVLRIQARLEDHTLVLEVDNPRPTVAPRRPDGGYGLRNAEERLRLLFNSQASLELDLTRSDWATTRIRIPQPA
jgi:LytS/YehU family sensor histidine kinase